MVFIEFKGRGGVRRIFVGKDEKSIVKDVKTSFGPGDFVSHEQISFEQAESLNLQFFASGIRSVAEGAQSFFIGTVNSAALVV